MTEQIKVLNELIDIGDAYVEASTSTISQLLDAFDDYTPEIIDDWEIGVVLMCVNSLTEHAVREREMPSKISVPNTTGPAVMRPYFEIAYAYVSHTLFGEQQQFTYEYSN